MPAAAPPHAPPVWRRVQHWAVVVLAAVLPIGKFPAEATLVIGLLAWLAGMVVGRRRPTVFKNPLTWLLAAWFLVAACSMHNSSDLHASFRGLWKLLKYFSLYLLVLDTVDSPAALRRVLVGMATGLLVVVGDGCWQAVFGQDLIYRRALAYTFVTVSRVTATFDHPDNLAIYLVSVAPIMLALGLRGERRWRRPLLALVGVTAIVLALSRTRVGLLGLLGALLMLSCWLRHWVPAALAGARAVLQLFITPAAVRAWAATQPTLLHWLTEPERLMYWQAALNMIQAHPVIGVGVNTFVKAYPAFRTAGDHFDTIGPYAHNQYLQLTAELGLVGLAVFLLVLARVFAALQRQLASRQHRPFEAAVSAGIGSGFVGYLITGGLESSFYYLRGSLTFWLLVGLLMAVEGWSSHAAAPKPQ